MLCSIKPPHNVIIKIQFIVNNLKLLIQLSCFIVAIKSENFKANDSLCQRCQAPSGNWSNLRLDKSIFFGHSSVSGFRESKWSNFICEHINSLFDDGLWTDEDFYFFVRSTQLELQRWSTTLICYFILCDLKSKMSDVLLK